MTCYRACMTRARTHRPTTSQRILAVLASLVLAAATVAVAQGDDDLVDNVTFESEMFRVDLYRDDAGDTVERFVEVDEGIPGDEIEYRITATNDGDRIYRPRQFAAAIDIPEGVTYVEGSADPESDAVRVEFSTDGGETFSESPQTPDGEAAEPEAYDAIQWVYLEQFEPGDELTFSYRVTVL